jgi:hypothetical protein
MPPQTLAEARRLIHPDDLAALDAAFVASKRNGAHRYAMRPATSSVSLT